MVSPPALSHLPWKRQVHHVTIPNCTEDACGLRTIRKRRRAFGPHLGEQTTTPLLRYRTLYKRRRDCLCSACANL
jgi:hypothetical protein